MIAFCLLRSLFYLKKIFLYGCCQIFRLNLTFFFYTASILDGIQHMLISIDYLWHGKSKQKVIGMLAIQLLNERFW